MKSYVIAGGSGFLGLELTRDLLARGKRVTVLSRNPRQAQKRLPPEVQILHWDGETQGPWARSLEGAEALVNLSGKSVDCRYTQGNKKKILRSRIASTRALGDAIEGAQSPPKLWINASTATIYADARDTPNTEREGLIGEGFSVSVARAWEDAFFGRVTEKTRKVALRTSMVLGHGRNSVFPVLKRLTRLALSGKFGDGGQMVSWIHIDDFLKAVRFLAEQAHIAGSINVSAPAPVSNALLLKTLRRAMGHYIALPVPRWMLEIGARILGTETELVLKSRYVLPERLLENRFQFDYPFVDEAFGALLSKPKRRSTLEQALSTAGKRFAS